MILTSNNRILTVNGKVVERKVNTFSFQTSGTQFPMRVGTQTNAYFQLSMIGSQSVWIDYGDGVVEKHSKADVVGRTYLAWTWNGQTTVGMTVAANVIQPHIYEDGNSGVRLITLRFEDFSQITTIRFNVMLAQGAISPDILYATNLTVLWFDRTQGITLFPRNLTPLNNLEQLTLNNYSTTIQTALPDSIFDLDLNYFDGVASFDLSDLVASNLFKINQWGAKLTTLRLDSCSITQFDETFAELINLQDLRITGNALTEIPNGLENMIELTVLYILPPEMPDFRNLNKLRLLWLQRTTLDLSTIPILWTGLFSLQQLVIFQSFINTNSRFNEFIGYFYTLITTHGSITPNGSPAPYPNRFRNISWGHSTLSFTGAKVAPTGYTQGVSNGTTTTIGQMVYVLQNQYNHVITHGAPII